MRSPSSLVILCLSLSGLSGAFADESLAPPLKPAKEPPTQEASTQPSLTDIELQVLAQLELLEQLDLLEHLELLQDLPLLKGE
jgi:hypothetical protein